MVGSNRFMISPAFFMSKNSLLRCAFALVFCFIVLSPSGSAKRRHGPSPLDTLGEEADQKVGWQILKQFRSLGIVGDYRFRFQLKVMPRREKTINFSGVMLGARGEEGPISRVDIALEEASIGEKGELVPAKTIRLFLENGLFANAFELDSRVSPAVPTVISSDRYFEPIVGSDFTVFDLLLPYMYWQEFYYEGRTDFRGRSSHVFWLYPPAEDELLKTKVSGVRVFIDGEFSSPMLVEIYDAEKTHVKTLTPVGLKKVDGQYFMNQIDVRNEITRDKTRFKVLDAAMGVELPISIFTPEGLVDAVYGTELGLVK